MMSLLHFIFFLLPYICTAQQAVIETPQTAFLGTVSPLYPDFIEHYRGIQYAVAPVDGLRLRPPLPFRTNTAITTATAYRADCIQYPATQNMGENCLHLNVFRPIDANPGNVKPVVVFVHGGGFNNGAGRNMPGDDLVAVGDVLYVSVNYRLGALGFLSHPAFDQEDPNNPTSGNYGLLDIIESLRWIQRYIRYFGGDPENVTLMGSSAGAIAIGFLLATPEAAGLYHKTALISYSALQGTNEPALGPLYWNYQKQRAISDATVAYLNCSSFIPQQVRDCMRDEFLFGSTFAQFANNGMWGDLYPPEQLLDHHVWGPIPDGIIVPDDPLYLFQRGQFQSMPILAGTNADEATSFTGDDFLENADDDDVDERIRVDFPEIAQDVVDFYNENVDDEPGFRYATVKTDQYLHCPIRRLFKYVLENDPEEEVFSFVFNELSSWRVAANETLRRVSHGSIGPYIHGQQSYGGVMLQGTPEEQRLHFDVMTYITNFARNGDPGFDSTGAHQWPRFTLDDEETMALETPNPRVVQDYKKDACEFWDANTPDVSRR